MATVNFQGRAVAFSAVLAALAPAAAFCWDGPGPLTDAGMSASTDAVPQGPYRRDKPAESGTAAGPELPASVCELVGGMSGGAGPEDFPSEFTALLEDGEGPVGTAIGYDLGEGVRLQGVGVYDPGDNYASLGPAFKLNLESGFAITTGMQMPVAVSGPERHSELFFAEFMLLF